MNYFYRIFILVFFSLSLFAQNPIPNPGFESWTNSEPVSWTTNNIALTAVPVTQSSDSHSGSSSIKGEVVNFLGNPYLATVSASSMIGPYFAISQNYEKLTGFYKLNSMNNDNFSVSAYLLDSNFGTVAIAAGEFSIATTSWLPFEAVFDYSSTTGNDAAYCRIDFFTGNTLSGQVTIGSYFLADDFELVGTATGIEPIYDSGVPAVFNLKQNYPNPFNPKTTIQFSIPEAADVTLTIFNHLGQQIDQVLKQSISAGTYKADWDAKNLPSGQYFYRITAGEFSDTKKLLLMK